MTSPPTRLATSPAHGSVTLDNFRIIPARGAAPSATAAVSALCCVARLIAAPLILPRAGFNVSRF